MDLTKDGCVLLADDDKSEVMLFQRAWDKVEYDVSLQVVNNGVDVIKYLCRQPPFDNREVSPRPLLLIMDLKLHRKSGFEVLEWLRNSESRQLPVIIYSSSQRPEDVNRVYDLGANSYVVKPLGLGRIEKLISNISAWWLEQIELPT